MPGRLQNKVGVVIKWTIKTWLILYDFPGRSYHRCKLVSSTSTTSWDHDRSFFDHNQSRGIGLESSILFAQEGAHVLLVDINIRGAENAAAIITKRFPNVRALATRADVGKEADVKAAVDTAVKEFGRLDVMVRVVDISSAYLDW